MDVIITVVEKTLLTEFAVRFIINPLFKKFGEGWNDEEIICFGKHVSIVWRRFAPGVARDIKESVCFAMLPKVDDVLMSPLFFVHFFRVEN